MCIKIRNSRLYKHILTEHLTLSTQNLKNTYNIRNNMYCAEELCCMKVDPHTEWCCLILHADMQIFVQMKSQVI